MPEHIPQWVRNGNIVPSKQNAQHFDLPNEIIEKILSYLHWTEWCNFASISKQFCEVIHSSTNWTDLFQQERPGPFSKSPNTSWFQYGVDKKL